jgi:hypothetical protein
MPDIGGIGRGLLKGALSATEKAAEKVKDAAEAASRRMSDDDDPDATQVVNTDDPDITQVIPGSQTGSHAPAAGQAPAVHGAAPLGPGPSGGRTITQGPSAPQGGGPQWPAPAGDAPPRPAVGPPAPHGSRPGPQRPVPAPPPHGGPQRSHAPATPQGAFPPPAATSPSAFSTPPQGSGFAPQHGAPANGPAVPTGAVDGAADEPSLADEPEDHADASEVQELVEMFQQLLAKRRPPAGPIPGEWSIGVGDLLAEHPKVPSRVRGLIVKLNRFGGVAYSPQEIAFDGEDVPWEKVTEVRTRHVVDYLVGDAVQQQVENLPMPWFPGRKRLLDALGQALLTITIATAKEQLEKFELDLRVPAEVAYKASFGRTKELGAGVVSALVLADPAVNQSLIATAQARGVTVTSGDDELLANADERADKIREKVKALEAELDRFTKRFGRSG